MTERVVRLAAELRSLTVAELVELNRLMGNRLPPPPYTGVREPLRPVPPTGGVSIPS